MIYRVGVYQISVIAVSHVAKELNVSNTGLYCSISRKCDDWWASCPDLRNSSNKVSDIWQPPRETVFVTKRMCSLVKIATGATERCYRLVIGKWHRCISKEAMVRGEMRFGLLPGSRKMNDKSHRFMGETSPL